MVKNDVMILSINHSVESISNGGGGGGKDDDDCDDGQSAMGKW